MMREWIQIGLLSCLVAAVTFGVAGPRPQKAPGPSAAEVRAIMESGEALLLDARPYADYEAGHIPGSINIPAHDQGKIPFILQLEDMLRSAPVLVLYCTGPECELADILATDLQSLGFPVEQMVLFTGGMEAWTTAGFEISTDTGFQQSLQP